MRFRSALIKLIKDVVKSSSFLGKIKSIDTGNYTCVVTPLDGGADYSAVKLKLTTDANKIGVIQVPAVGSVVRVSMLNGDENNAIVTNCETIDELIVNLPAGKKININNGTFGGLVKVAPLTQQLNALETQLNSLKTVFNAWAPVAGDGGAVLKTAITAWAAQNVAATQQNLLENKNVNHG